MTTKPSIQQEKAAIHGGRPALSEPLPPMYPGGLRLDDEEIEAVVEVLRNKRLFRYYGPNQGVSKVAALEEAFRLLMGTNHALAVTSGTAALICGLIGLGIGPGDEVIVPAYTWIASASAVVAVGAVPVMAEVDTSLTLDPTDIENKISPYTKALLPVHMRGAPSRMDAIMAIAHKHGLKVLEDTAQADGASFQGRRLGSIGDAGAFSLQFNKIITSGEGGMLICNEREVYKRAVMYHDVVGGSRNQVPADQILPGINFRMPELLGAVALIQLKRLDGLLEDMRQRKAILKTQIADVASRKGVTFRTIHDPQGDAAISLIFFLPDVPSADRVAKALAAEGVGCMRMFSRERSDYHVYYHWTPIMNQRSWSEASGPWRNHPRKVEYKLEMCPQTLDLLGRAVHLDISPDLTNSQLEEFVEAVNKVFESEL